MMNERIPEAEPGTRSPSCTTIQVPLCDKQLTTEVASELSLPDYQPEIRRLLRIGSSTTPPTAYATGGGMELTGTVDHYVLYVGNDGQVYCSPFSAEYRMQLPFDNGMADNGLADTVSEPLVCVCDTTVEGTAGRVTAPRRLSIRCRVKARARVWGERSLCCPEESGLVPGSVERLERSAEVARVFCGVSDSMQLEDDMILPPGSELRVVCAEGQVMVNETAPGNDLVTCRGEVTLKLLLTPLEPSAEEGSEPSAPALPTVALRRVPFSVTVDMPGVTPDCTACAHGACPELSVQVEEGRIHTDLSLVVQVTAQRNETVTYTGDLYSTRTAEECRFADCPAAYALHAVQGNLTLSDSLPLTEAGVDPSAQVVDILASAQPEAVSCSRGRGVLTGDCHFQLLLYRGGDWNTAEVTLPFRYEFELPVGTDPQSPTFDGCVTVLGSRARMDGERLGLDAELSVALRLTDGRSLQILSGVSFGEEIARTRGEYRICFPAPGDTLWSVAKRYHAPLTALAAANDLPPSASLSDSEELSGIRYLIV